MQPCVVEKAVMVTGPLDLPPFRPARVAVRTLAERVPPGLPRFLIAGGGASLVNWLVRFPLSGLMPFRFAVVAAYSVGMVIGFALYRVWVFPGSQLGLRAQISRFVVVNAAGLVTVMLGADVLVALFGATSLLTPVAAEALAHGVAIACGAGVNFIGHRAVTFAGRRNGNRQRTGLRPGSVGGSSSGNTAMRVEES